MTRRTAGTNTLNLCAGPGGWETGALLLDSSPVPSVEFLWEDLAAELAAAGWEYMNVETIDAHDLGAAAGEQSDLKHRASW